MLSSKLYSSLVYLDRDYIAGKYEITTGLSPQSQITKAQGKKAGASIPVFSAEVSATETRTFPVSTLEMLSRVLPELENEPKLHPGLFSPAMTSKIGWLQGTLGTVTAFSSVGNIGTEGHSKSNEQGCFTLHGDVSVTMITTPDYFISGLDALLKMHKILLRDLKMPVRALVRVLAAKNYTDDWITIPYLIYEEEVP
ncbi:hypothetical protein ACIGHN_10445 [Acidovorax sp. NPDC077693]|uniref:hypothetical protein n=1 Tax=unclassified Acidovorax TaxID=2684926 RepID=UPI0037C58BD4